MAARGSDLIPVVQKSYDLCAGLYTQVNRFPRAQRGLLGRVILEDALAMLVSLTVANRRADKAETLREASGRLDALRITLRLGKHLGFVSNGGYADLSKGADEVGRMLGGWLKYEQGGAAAQAGGPPPGVERSPVPKKRAGGVRYTMKSPTVERYLRLKLEHPQSVVFITVGAFCQTYFEDATECGRVLRVAVRDLAAESESARILTCGIPKARLETYVGLLRQAGREVHVE
ncbi:MAG: hypothetical protein ACREWG_17565 [Gammaproteobacteria bacterium]